MAKTILIVGYGVGISAAVAEKFGKEGFQVALVARTKDRLETAAKELSAKGIKAAAFTADVSDLGAIKDVVGKVRGALGPITAIHWNAYAGAPADLLTVAPADLLTATGVATTSLLAAVQAALPDLEKEKDAAVLVTNGGFGLFDANVDAYVAKTQSGPLAIANSAKHKLVGVLHQQLKERGVYVGDVVVTGLVKGTAWDNGSATLEASTIAGKFWELYTGRTVSTATV
jgi:short-subunit dehydrogenase